MSEEPVFAVVGRVNKGKSSIISTLAEDDSVRVGPRPGTTRECREFPVRLDGETLFTLVDTPGFEEAPRALAWLKARAPDAANRATAVAALIEEFDGTEDFIEECRLLKPIIDGASIIYVVDGTKPYRANYEAEMEILRWTGRAGMALINRIGDDDHSDDWRRALDQYFKIVRDFDAFSVTFVERLKILGVFRELRTDWSDAIKRAISGLESERNRRRAECCRIVRDLLVDSLSFTLEVTVESASDIEPQKQKLEARFHDALRAKENKARKKVEKLYAHNAAQWEGTEQERPVFGEDLFADETWKGLGLSTVQTLGLWTAAGAAVGGGIDVATGGATFFTGALIGGTVGAGIGVLQMSKRFASAAPGAGLSDWIDTIGKNKRFTVGPHAHVNFPFILLDRALLHYQAVLSRTHARRDVQVVGDGEDGRGLVAALDQWQRRRLDAQFRKIRKRPADVAPEVRDDLYKEIMALVTTLLPESAPENIR